MRLRARSGALIVVAVLTAAATACTSSTTPQTAKRAPTASAASSSPAAKPHHRALPPVTISAVGDTMLGNTPAVPPDPAGYLAPIRAALRDHADVVFGNLEGTITDSSASGKCAGAATGTCYAFRMPPSFAQVLARLGFTVMNNANNHSHDFGEIGLQQTVESLDRAGIAHEGRPGEIAVVRAHHVRIAFVGFAPYSDTASMLDVATARGLVQQARHRADLVVAYMHAGAEGSDRTHVTGAPETYLGENRGDPEAFAHAMIDAGADLVLGSGPHVLRGMQFYRGHLIAYSLGNFVNYHNFGGGSGVLADSAILHVTLSGSGRFRSGRLIPVLLDSSGHATVGGGSVDLVRTLSQEDFGRSAARVDANGRISAPAPR